MQQEFSKAALIMFKQENFKQKMYFKRLTPYANNFDIYYQAVTQHRDYRNNTQPIILEIQKESLNSKQKLMRKNLIWTILFAMGLGGLLFLYPVKSAKKSRKKRTTKLAK